MKEGRELMQSDDDMVDFYIKNRQHYETGLTRIGCSKAQALAYSSLFNYFRSVYHNIVDEVIEGYPEGALICDVGMGLGHDLEHFASRHNTKQFVGVELSESTVEIIRERLSSKGLSNVFLDSSEHWYRKRNYDLVINNCVFEHVADPVVLARQIKECLRPEGQFVFVVPSHSYWIFWQWIYYMLMFPIRGKPKTHSVLDKVMKNAMECSDLVLETQDTYGFRPPQPFFCGVKVATIKRIEQQQEILEQILKLLRLGNCCYLNIYCGYSGVGNKSKLNDRIAGVVKRKHLNLHQRIPFSDLLFFCKVYCSYQFLIYPRYLLRKFIKQVFK